MVSSVFLVPCLRRLYTMYLLTKCTKVHAPHAQWSQTKWNVAFGAQTDLLTKRARQGEWVTCAPPKPKLPKGLQQNAFIFKLFSTVVYYKILNTIHVLYNSILLVILYTVACICQSQTPDLSPSLPPFTWVGYSLWDHKELAMAEQQALSLPFTFPFGSHRFIFCLWVCSCFVKKCICVIC